MEVTVDDEAQTRVRHIYTVSASITGKVLRISNPSTDHDVSLHVGDQVIANDTIVAVMKSTAPSFLDIRSREELQAGRRRSLRGRVAACRTNPGGTGVAVLFGEFAMPSCPGA
jgi:hypothetical protein